jgi:predicted DNA-binding transcriptional regulator YafY
VTHNRREKLMEDAQLTVTDFADDQLELVVNCGVVEVRANLTSEYGYVELDPENLRRLRDFCNDALGSEPQDTPSLNATLLQHGIDSKLTCRFRYAKGNNESVIETRFLVPYNIVSIGDHETVMGYDPDRDEPRAYRLDRIKGLVEFPG